MQNFANGWDKREVIKGWPLAQKMTVFQKLEKWKVDEWKLQGGRVKSGRVEFWRWEIEKWKSESWKVEEWKVKGVKNWKEFSFSFL